MKQALGWLAVIALVVGGGLYMGAVQRLLGAPARVHVGDPKPEAAAASAAASVPVSPAAAVPAAAATPALAAPAAPAAPASSAAPRATQAPVPGAAPHGAPRPEDDRLMIVRDADPLAAPKAQTSAAAAAASAPAPSPAKPQPDRRDTSRHAIASRDAAGAGAVRYGGGDRAHLMGRGAGPVYNLRGGGGGAAPSDGANVSARQLSTMMQSAESQIDAANLDPAAKAALKRQLENADPGSQGQQPVGR